MSPERVGNHQENLPEQCVMDAASTTLKKLLPHLQHIIFEDSICQIQTGAASAKGQQGVARRQIDHARLGYVESASISVRTIFEVVACWLHRAFLQHPSYINNLSSGSVVLWLIDHL